MESSLSFGHWVVPGRAERSATDETAQRQPQATRRAVDLEGLDGRTTNTMA